MQWVWQALAGLAVVSAYAALAAWCGASGRAEREWERVSADGHRSEGPDSR